MRIVPSYPLLTIKDDFANPNKIVISGTARRMSVALGLNETDIVDIVKSLSSRDFYKTMKGTVNTSIMHDVYKTEWKGIYLYLKFIQNPGDPKIMLVSCKEDESYV